MSEHPTEQCSPMFTGNAEESLGGPEMPPDKCVGTWVSTVQLANHGDGCSWPEQMAQAGRPRKYVCLGRSSQSLLPLTSLNGSFQGSWDLRLKTTLEASCLRPMGKAGFQPIPAESQVSQRAPRQVQGGKGAWSCLGRSHMTRRGTHRELYGSRIGPAKGCLDSKISWSPIGEGPASVRPREPYRPSPSGRLPRNKSPKTSGERL